MCGCLQKAVDDAAETVETLNTEVRTANKKADHSGKALTSAVAHLRAARDANSTSPATSMVTTDTRTSSPEIAKKDAGSTHSCTTSAGSISVIGRSDVMRQGNLYATTSRAAASKAADEAAEEGHTLMKADEEQALAAAVCHPKTKAVTDAESEVDHEDFIAAGFAISDIGRVVVMVVDVVVLLLLVV